MVANVAAAKNVAEFTVISFVALVNDSAFAVVNDAAVALICVLLQLQLSMLTDYLPELVS